MPSRPSSGRRRPATIAAVAVAGAVAASVWFTSGSASAGTLSGALYRDPNTQVVKWVAANPNDSRTPVIRDKIASQPQAHWLSSFNPSTVQSDVSTYIGAANAANRIPVLSVYEIPNRDCGGASAGGAPDFNQYQTWVSNFSRGLGDRTVIVILETDSIALQTCLSASELAARNQALTTATQTIKAGNANAKVYLDGGHSAWNSASEQANRLRAAGVQYADGFYTNVSNFQSTSSEASYGRSIISALAGAGVPGKRQIIDTSRNGGASGDWCADDNTDRRIGQYPTTNTGDANIDAYLWIKPPGEADGCGYAAGSFVPDLAYSLASSAPYPPSEPPTTAPPTTAPPSTPSTTPSPTPTRTPSPTPPSTPSPTTPPPATGACTAAYQTVNSWQGGFQGQVTVTAGTSAVNGWTVTWTLASGQSISQVWNGTLSVSGSTATVKNASWNGSLAARASTQFGFTANGSASNPTLTCTSP
ncbi:glucanase [Planosporangium mesophilum]|uniref:Glucanase n=1 Tax=Planosporangium mesophilum TaxID=689768 RepID=A0A8J3TE28_9ACTN|nr:cellobiohydrolase [Planosporangium mesophilum]GII23771.1 glucanase [Planosporangium mesophilum]